MCEVRVCIMQVKILKNKYQILKKQNHLHIEYTLHVYMYAKIKYKIKYVRCVYVY